jgi:hypothetical protein
VRSAVVWHNPRMAKSRKKPKVPAQTADRHKSKKMIRLPESLYAELARLADQHGRPLSWEVRLALEHHVRQRRHGESGEG